MYGFFFPFHVMSCQNIFFTILVQKGHVLIIYWNISMNTYRGCLVLADYFNLHFVSLRYHIRQAFGSISSAFTGRQSDYSETGGLFGRQYRRHWEKPHNIDEPSTVINYYRDPERRDPYRQIYRKYLFKLWFKFKKARGILNYTCWCLVITNKHLQHYNRQNGLRVLQRLLCLIISVSTSLSFSFFSILINNCSSYWLIVLKKTWNQAFSILHILHLAFYPF